MSAVSQKDQLDLFGQLAPLGPILVTAKAVPEAVETQTMPATDRIAFDATGWYGTPENIAKLDDCLGALKPGDQWINGHGVTEIYLGKTVTGHQLHQDPKGRHIYKKHTINTMPLKYYQPTAGNRLTTDDFTLSTTLTAARRRIAREQRKELA